MRLMIFDDYDAVSEFAAKHVRGLLLLSVMVYISALLFKVANCIRKFAPTAEKRFVLGRLSRAWV